MLCKINSIYIQRCKKIVKNKDTLTKLAEEGMCRSRPGIRRVVGVDRVFAGLKVAGLSILDPTLTVTRYRKSGRENRE